MNTGVNFAVLNFAFYALDEKKIVSSIIATCFAMILSFFLNRKFVFRADRHWKQPLMFIAVTASGVLLIQNIIFALGLALLNKHAFVQNLIHDVTGLHVSKDFIQVNLSNVFGSLGAMVWNYNGYKHFVFKGNSEKIVDDINLPA